MPFYVLLRERKMHIQENQDLIEKLGQYLRKMKERSQKKSGERLFPKGDLESDILQERDLEDLNVDLCPHESMTE